MPKIVEIASPDIRSHLWSFYWIARLVQAKTIIELGVRQGDSTRAWLAAAYDLNAQVISYDLVADCYLAVVAKAQEAGLSWECYASSWEFRQGDSIGAGEGWTGDQVDVVFIDTDHTLVTTTKELAVWQRRVRPGGVMVLHDYGLPERDGRDGVQPAVDDFMRNDKADIWTLEAYPWAQLPGDAGLAILWK